MRAPPEAARQILEIAVVEVELGEVQELCEALRQSTRRAVEGVDVQYSR